MPGMESLFQEQNRCNEYEKAPKNGDKTLKTKCPELKWSGARKREDSDH